MLVFPSLLLAPGPSQVCPVSFLGQGGVLTLRLGSRWLGHGRVMKETRGSPSLPRLLLLADGEQEWPDYSGFLKKIFSLWFITGC